MLRVHALFGAAVLCVLAGCASYDGRGLVPGTSTGADVERLMGTPDLRVANADGGSTWYFARAPIGRHTYAVGIGADGVMRGIEQRRTLANVAKLARRETTAQQARELFGPPERIVRAALRPVDVWEYHMLNFDDKRVLWIEFSDDGRVEGVLEMHDVDSDPPSGPAMP